MLKTVGYLISVLSVVLLSVVAWKATGEDATLRACLVVGALASIAGMVCRWLSYRLDEQPRQPAQQPLARSDFRHAPRA